MPPFPPSIDYLDLLALAARFWGVLGGGPGEGGFGRDPRLLDALLERIGPLAQGLVDETMDAFSGVMDRLDLDRRRVGARFMPSRRGILPIPVEDLTALFSRLPGRLNAGVPYVDLLRQVGGLPESYQTPLEAALSTIGERAVRPLLQRPVSEQR